jgi:beta-phosphoglucomutase-like phosphatase (HAD superfamily)
MTQQNSIINKCKAIILDMDGVIVDSEPIHGQAFRMFLNELQVPYTEDFVNNLVGHSVDSNIQTINREYFSNDPLNISEGIKTRDALYLDLITDQPLKPLDGIEDLIILCKKKDIKLGLASSSVREQVDAILKSLSQNNNHHINFETVFDVTVAGNEVSHKKPAPDIYDKAIRELGIDRLQCIAIEDSGAGIRSAKANDITCIALRNQYLKENESLEADIVVNSINEVVDMINLISR